MRARSQPLVYHLEIQAIDQFPWRAIPAPERLRRLLKATSRSYGFKVKIARPVGPERVVFRALVEDGEDAA